ncbi:peptidoglycan-associated lipoprotein Pal [Natronospira bacteriovora]|uniref:Peptidoglycan-associated lipoprotein n=1 Tax=Natronospira bacteriovora TaxID=3069753 RepID=A0ABU0W3C9_9GAMM|nr:peptidoglycan-associated lipoprotein Pal [Natronospira sp. AB-CW4]MDQ2068506.1 peptidoglycan-associated lipoprotein Pal [Natronospira sp. AB-CW4]
MNRIYSVLAVLVMAILLAACGTTQEVPDEEAAEREAREAERRDRDEWAEIDGLRDDEMAEFRELDDPDSPLADRIVYFDFDRYDVKSEYREMLREHATYLRNNARLTVRLEGHTDERGSREYNIGLGDRRAQAVKRVLVLNGVSEGQIRTVSYGEERPAVAESNEEAWARNRRVELDYIR